MPFIHGATFELFVQDMSDYKGHGWMITCPDKTENSTQGGQV